MNWKKSEKTTSMNNLVRMYFEEILVEDYYCDLCEERGTTSKKLSINGEVEIVLFQFLIFEVI